MNKRIPFFVLISAIALVSLFVIQFKWMQKSVALAEEQFDQKVSMALCMAVDQISLTEETNKFKSTCSVAPDGQKNVAQKSFLLELRKIMFKALWHVH